MLTKKLKYLILIFIALINIKSARPLDDELLVNEIFSNHYSTVINSVIDNYVSMNTPMWLSSWNLETNEYPFDFSHSDSIPCRVYLDRSVDAPGGASLYWNLPDIAATIELSRSSGNTVFEKASKAYVKSYLELCTAKNGIILWGNHYYYDVVKDKVMKFYSDEKPNPINVEKEKGDLHEMRPILPLWELLYEWFPKKIEKHIRQSAKSHIVDFKTGEFNRHANQLSEYSFLEAGSILINSLTFLYSKTGDPELLKMSDSILEYSFSNRHPETGLVINSPSKARWDQYTSTTEIGLWSINILKSIQYIPNNMKVNWVEKVEKALYPWLIHGFNIEVGKFYGALNVNDAKSIEKTDNYPYKPDTYTDIWNPLFPTHNYPLQFAECCLVLYKMTGKEIYKVASENWLSTIKNQMDDRSSKIMYAENYARIIHFLINYDNILNNNWAKKKARELAIESISNLYIKEAQMFRGHTGENRYDCVDGVGYLFFALYLYETNDKAELDNSFF